MAGITNAGIGEQVERETDESTGVGLLSRFLGAVFLVLLGGLLLLDRALLRANQSQADLDTQTAALLAESFLSSQAVLLDRLSTAVTASHAVDDSVSTRKAIDNLLQTTEGTRVAWFEDSNDKTRVRFVERAQPLSAEILNHLMELVPGQGLLLTIVPIAPEHKLIVLAVQTPVQSRVSQTVGLAVDAKALQSWLGRTKSGTRLTLNVLSGSDTIISLGHPSETAQGLTSTTRLIRLPTGGTWAVTSTHALATRSLRWAIWILGVLGALFLAFGLLREQRRALQATGRSIELERLYSDVKRANQAKSEFLANVSHELRTPLNAIVGFVELLREGFYGDLSPRQVQPVDRIAASATHLRHLVDQVLDIAKIAAGRLEIHAETIVLRPFVLNIASELESLVSEKGLTFSLSVGASLPRVRTDPTHLRQILINLIGNAVKYTPAGTVSVRARLVNPSPADRKASSSADSRSENSGGPSLQRPPHGGAWVAVQVGDTGIGIARGDLDRIFDEFEQVNAGPRGDSIQRGTGLGLAISRRLARLLGGEITVESELARGSTFTVWVPVNPADLIRDPIPTPARGVDLSNA